MAPVWDSFGADVLTIPGAEVYTALSTGLIEASDWSSPAANFRLGYAEIAPYYSKPGDYYMGGTGEVILTLENWNSLSPDLQAILFHAARSHAINMWNKTAYDDFVSIGKLTEAGAEMIPWEEDLVQEMKQGISDVNRDLVMESPDGERIYNHIQEFLKIAPSL